MARMMADCRRFPSESNCTLTIIGDEDEVVRAAAEHAVSVHGHEDTDELRDQIRGMLEDESSYAPGMREQEPLPG
jgi:predicted small metal-binding protein